MSGLPNLVLQQTGLSLAFGSLWRPQLNTGTLGGRMIGEAGSVKRDFDAAIASSALAGHRTYLLSLLRPAIWILRTTEPPKPGQSKFGGWPDLPLDCEWPSHSGGPHEFIAQFNFVEMPAAQHGLPPDGILFLFAATTPIEHISWQDPGYIYGLYCPAGTTLIARPPPPRSAAQLDEQRLCDEIVRESKERHAKEVALGLRWPDEPEDDVPVEQRQFGVRFLPGLDLPHSIEQRQDWPVRTREESWTFLADLHEIWRCIQTDAPTLGGDHFLGYPGQSSLAYDPTPNADWAPFLCLSSHDELGWCWHDGDYLHVFVRPVDLARGNFASLASDAG